MFLESVTLQGFKSFADKTTLRFEPGITVVVGPNGSGKSNVVDALTWVLGSHSPKSLRGGQMSDVIFAGAPGRAALGRAVVEIRIDNSSGVLPIDFTEVTVSRAMYGSGENDYAINGVGCRLLDVAELLSDTGLGRENHTIVGQGRLDAVLNARPEERRAFIEEAAGILKHRRRKERALRKLAQMEDHLERLTDVLHELGRSLRPLERQARAATRHAELRARRDAIVQVLTLRRYDRVRTELDAARHHDAQLGAREDAQRARAEELRRTEHAVEQAIGEGEPRVRQAAATHVRLSTVGERLDGLVGRIDERREGLVAAVEEPVAGRDPAALLGEADTLEESLTALGARLAAAEREETACSDARAAAEQALRAHERAVADEARRAHEARERRLRREGEIRAVQSQLEQAAGEEARLTVQIDALDTRLGGLAGDIAHARDEIRRLDAAAPRLAARLEEANRHLVRRTDICDDLLTREREHERERASLRARADALRATAAHASEGAEAVRAAARDGQLPDIVGTVSDTVEVDAAHAAAVARALGELGAALLVASPDDAGRVLSFARTRPGTVHLLAGDDAAADAAGAEPAPAVRAAVSAAGGSLLADHVRAPATVRAALARLLRDTFVVDDLTTAAALGRRFPHCWFVTVDGESAGARGWSGGTAGEPPAVLAVAGAREAEQRLGAVEDELSVVHRQLADADREREAAREEVDSATLLLQESDGRITAAAERLQRLEAEQARTREERGARGDDLAALHAVIAGRRERLTALRAEEAAHAGDSGPDQVLGEGRHRDGGDAGAAPVGEQDAARSERLEADLAARREAEVQARLETRSARDRVDQVRQRIGELRAEAADVEAQVRALEARRARRVAAIERCAELRLLAVRALRAARTSQAAADEARTRVDDEQSARREELGAIRERLRDVQGALAESGERRHAAALRLQELEATAGALREELEQLTGTDPDAVLTAARSDAAAAVPSPDVDETGDAAAAPLADDSGRDERLAAAQRRVEREIGALGDVNPLARVEYERASERHAFMQTQLDDVRASRDDLLEVIDAVDGRIEQVFADAFADVADAFDEIFPRLFPGGEGRLVLTEPGDMLTTGVEVEARPAGKRVKRLSLLSGGERSLTALAVMFAIFAARPSPFYVLDEVEAALDDVNLQRFLDVVSEFRSASQLILVTHQKRTMEIADLLYGVSMQRDGVSRVIGQRAEELVRQA